MKNKYITFIAAIFILLSSVGCSKSEYDYKSLGFVSVAEMEAAFSKGYHTKKKLDEMTKPVTALSEATSSQSPAISSPSSEPQKTKALEDNTPFSPSFDCSRASSAPEKLICSDRDLAKADVALNSAYSKALDTAKDKSQLKSEQIAWMKKERNACSDKQCMLQQIERRISVLQSPKG